MRLLTHPRQAQDGLPQPVGRGRSSSTCSTRRAPAPRRRPSRPRRSSTRSVPTARSTSAGSPGRTTSTSPSRHRAAHPRLRLDSRLDRPRSERAHADARGHEPRHARAEADADHDADHRHRRRARPARLRLGRPARLPLLGRAQRRRHRRHRRRDGARSLPRQHGRELGLPHRDAGPRQRPGHGRHGPHDEGHSRHEDRGPARRRSRPRDRAPRPGDPEDRHEPLPLPVHGDADWVPGTVTVDFAANSFKNADVTGEDGNPVVGTSNDAISLEFHVEAPPRTSSTRAQADRSTSTR